MNSTLTPALFLDRDGVINVDYGYVYRVEDFHFVDGVFQLVSEANRAGYKVIVVTNQAGIGRGYYSESDFSKLTTWMLAQFSRQGAKIDAVYFCPFHAEHGIGAYRQISEYRKPAPGMILKAALEHKIDLMKSIIIGDKISDITAGQRASVGTLLYIGNEEEVSGAIKINNLKDAFNFIHQYNVVNNNIFNKSY
jgi:D-glycero-D-manno-heptose 1,7-bisphosphate phosphatase